MPSFHLACDIDWDGVAPLVSDRRVELLVAVALHESGAIAGEAIEVGISFCDLDRIAELNAEHRGVPGPTDVLSFPIDGLEEPVPTGVPRVLGDVMTCVDHVREQLATGTTMQGDETLEAALERCIVHGVLHLAGFDHERGELEANEMFELEQLVLDRARGVRDRAE